MDYPHITRHPVIFRDLDSMGHVNNAVYITYFEVARTEYMLKLFEIGPQADIPIILASVACDFRAPARYGDVLCIGTGVSRLGKSSFDMVYRIETEDGRLLVEGKSVQVVYHYGSRTAMPIPDHFRANVAAVQGDWVPSGVVS